MVVACGLDLSVKCMRDDSGDPGGMLLEDHLQPAVVMVLGWAVLACGDDDGTDRSVTLFLHAPLLLLLLLL